jgi:hypothetical protein
LKLETNEKYKETRNDIIHSQKKTNIKYNDEATLLSSEEDEHATLKNHSVFLLSSGKPFRVTSLLQEREREGGFSGRRYSIEDWHLLHDVIFKLLFSGLPSLACQAIFQWGKCIASSSL